MMTTIIIIIISSSSSSDTNTPRGIPTIKPTPLFSFASAYIERHIN